MSNRQFDGSANTIVTTVSVQLSEATSQKLQRRASEQGMPMEEFARAVLEREVESAAAAKSTAEWIADWLAWTSSRPKQTNFVDDSRESIY
jgi:hypothetical protein